MLNIHLRSALNFRVTFGVSSSPGQFPWVAALLYRRGSLSLPLCAAALISRTLLLTAAHCTTNLGGFTLHRARLGQIDVTGAVKSPGVEVGKLPNGFTKHTLINLHIKG